MACICYKDKKFQSGSIALIDQANEIIEQYQAEGYQLTLRQLYYQFVARDIIENNLKSYNRIGNIVNDARLAGLIDWDAIEDRTRNIVSVNHWDNPSQIVRSAADQFRIDKWENQDNRIEVWIEKEALSGIIEPVCEELDLPFLSCRGYVSQSEMWSAGMRFRNYCLDHKQFPVIIHLGDHDPSGIDMTRDISDRLEMFVSAKIEINRIALNYDQIEQYKPPPNPAKMTDSRFNSYSRQFGNESWELDALEPKILSQLIRKTVSQYRDEVKWNVMVDKENKYRKKLLTAANNYRWDG